MGMIWTGLNLVKPNTSNENSYKTIDTIFSFSPEINHS